MRYYAFKLERRLFCSTNQLGLGWNSIKIRKAMETLYSLVFGSGSKSYTVPDSISSETGLFVFRSYFSFLFFFNEEAIF